MRRNLKNLFVLGGLLLGASLYAQEKTVTGTVTDPDGFPVADAVVKTTSGKEAYTDENGVFSIEAKQGDLVTVEAVGLPTQTFAVGAGSEYNVSLKPSETVELEGAVVTALGITREKKSLGYASQEVKGDVIAAARGNNPLNSLSGNVAGLSISNNSGNLGGSTRIVLRGLRSITGENRPLIVIDGIPMSNNNVNGSGASSGSGGRDYGDGAFDMNPDDVESINVLKGGPASALYGSRGANGVIMITTKKGKKGRDEITINTGVSFDQVAISPKLQKLYGGGSKDDFSTITVDGKQYNIVEYQMDESWGPKYNGQKVLHWNAFNPEDPTNYMVEREWKSPKHDVDSFYNTGITYTNSATFSKSYENTNAKLAISNVNQSGIIPNSSLKRTTVNLGVDNKFGDKFQVSGDMNYVRTDGFNRPEFGYGDNSVIQKFYQWGQRSLDFSALKNYKNSKGEQLSWNRTAWNNATPLYSDNPYWIVNENTSDDRRDRFYGNVKLRYDILPGLYATGAIYGDHYNLQIQERVAIGSQATSGYTLYTRQFTEMNYEGRLNFEKKWTDFSLNAFAGVNRRHESRSNVNAGTSGGLVVPNLYSLSNSMASPTVSNYRSKKRVNSVFAGASFGFYDLFYLDLTARNDWSSTLPENNNSYFYPSVSGAFVFSNLIKQDWLTFGKIRGGWSRVANDTDPYNLIDTYANSTFTGTTNLGDPYYLLPAAKANRNLKPEMIDSWEVGLEMQFFKNRFGFDVTYYQQKTNDLIVQNTTGAETGFTAKWYNAGVMENKGIEAMVRITPIQTEEFSWDFAWNFAKNDNEIVELYGDLQSITLASAPFKAGVYAMLGSKYGQIRGTDFIYDDQGNKVVGANGLYVSSAVKNLGSVLPDYNMGFRNTFSYKNVSLSALIDVQKGGKYFALTNMWGMYSGMLDDTAANGVRENGVISQGVTGSVKSNGDGTYTVTNTAENTKVVDASAYYGNYYSGPTSQNVFDSDYIKLREVTLSYTFPKKWAGPFSNVIVSAFGRNLATWGLDNKDFDPEVATGGSGNVQGLEGGSLPSTRSFGMNLKLQF
ncbi:SusC/RagA family TonB-linked outer membrane protein [uncultured Empedobacter sp.]|uniref:SusC/RagA family TonB-linked outer membrane protein n=1 Tax=uncultured Empedobacter sp. TaxID=410844 RepID=UPI0026210E70|nr:SusC/RagA family TonB-linked outer membrane protein [uncultured Empedobacter sp.]